MNWIKKLNEPLIDTAWPILSTNEIYDNQSLNMTDSHDNLKDSESMEELMPWENKEDKYKDKNESSNKKPTVEKEFSPESSSVYKKYKSQLVSEVVYGTILPGLIQWIDQAAE